MHELYANTGVQLLCFPLGPNVRAARTGLRWQVCRLPGEDRPRDYIQWRIQNGKLFLAVDTGCGDVNAGHFASAEASWGDSLPVVLEKLLYRPDDKPTDQPLDVGRCAFRIRASGSGEPRPVHLVVDFGNSRTGALLLEVSGQLGGAPEMLPLGLVNRWQLDVWNEKGEFDHRRAPRWFASHTHWCAPPYRPADVKRVKKYRKETRTGMFGRKYEVDVPYEEDLPSRLFEDWSAVRLGTEAEDVVFRAIRGGLRTGVSSPKRYLWAKDSLWLEGEDWHMADPCNDYNNGDGSRVARLQGPLLRYLYEDDRDDLILPDKGVPVRSENLAAQTPTSPRDPPRVFMVAALYELLCQAYAHVNSVAYRNQIGRSASLHYLASLTLTYPSGAIVRERDRFEMQARKAALIFHQTLGRTQKSAPHVSMGLDEASAVHLAYLWSEVGPLGAATRLWFNLAGREEPIEKRPVAPAVAATAPSPPAPPRPGAPPRPQPGPTPTPAPAPSVGPANEAARVLRIACIDIGGGTTDLMIARYTFNAPGGIENEIRGEIIHRDGIPVAGDRLVKRLLERVIVPRFREAAGLDREQTQFLFGPEIPENRRYRSERVKWVNNLFVPLAHAYLERAARDLIDEPIDHTDGLLVDMEFLDRLQKTMDERFGIGQCSVHNKMDLKYDRAVFDSLVNEAFYELLFDFCKRIVEHKTDLVLLAGQPSRLQEVRKLVGLFVPLPPARIISMYGYRAGAWYPYQDPSGRWLGQIVDPKSAVVVGAALHFLTTNGMLPQFRFKMADTARKESYFWGVMTDEISGISANRVLFERGAPPGTTRRVALETNRLLIGRRFDDQETACASAVYLLELDKGDRLGRSEVTVTLAKGRDARTGEEIIDMVDVEGVVAGEPAVPYNREARSGNVRWDWRTLASERFFLDSGTLDSIEFPPSEPN